MDFIDESSYLALIEPYGLEIDETGAQLGFGGDAEVYGFDFANLSVNENASPFDIGRENTEVEHAMVTTMLRLFSDLALFPIYLYSADNEWTGDEDLAQLKEDSIISDQEEKELRRLADNERTMDVLVIDEDEMEAALNIIMPQFVAFDTTCSVTDARGRALVIFSRDVEASFNTTDPEIYREARNLIIETEGLPFEVILVD